MIRINLALATVGAVVFMTATLALAGASFVEASDQKEPAPHEEKLNLTHVIISRLTDKTLKEVTEGVVVVPEASRNKEMMARVYVQALPEANTGSLVSKMGGSCCILAAGPVLNSTGQVAARSLVRRGQELELTIVVADSQKGDREKTIPVRPLIYAPLQLPAGTYTLTTTWQSLESLSDGKPAKAKPLSYSCEFTHGEKPAPKEASEGGSTEPKGLKLTARLISKENAYPLDLDDKTPEQFRKLVDEARSKGGPLPGAPTVNLVLELRYTGTFGTELDICLGKGETGPVNGLTLDLKGPGALSASVANVRGARVFPTIVKLVAGKTHRVTLGKLEVYDGRTTQSCYWTQPGEYTLVVSCGVVEGGEKGLWREAGKVVSAPIKLRVGGPKAAPPKAAKPVGEVQRPEIKETVIITNVGKDVQIEVSSGRPFPIVSARPELQIGAQVTRFSRYPKSGELSTLIFTMSGENFAKTKDGDAIVVTYRPDSQFPWFFGNLNKKKNDTGEAPFSSLTLSTRFLRVNRRH